MRIDLSPCEGAERCRQQFLLLVVHNNYQKQVSSNSVTESILLAEV